MARQNPALDLNRDLDIHKWEIRKALLESVPKQYKQRMDRIYHRDTIRLFSRRDTIFKDVVRWRERFVRYTVYHARTYTIPVTVEKEVPLNHLTKWQRIRLQILNVITALLLIYLAYRLGKMKLLKNL